MRKILLAMVAMAAFALHAPAALADPADETVLSGSCGADAFNDTSSDGVLGGPRVWNGVVMADVVLADPDAPATPVGGTLSCWIRINTGGEHLVLESAHGVTTLAAAGRLTYTADPGDAVYLCTHVTFDHGNRYDQCLPLQPPTQPYALCDPSGFSGSQTYASPGVGATPSAVTWTMTLELTCTGNAPLAGTYSLTLDGSGAESCFGLGSGNAGVSGSGPNGALSGSRSYASWGSFYFASAPGAGTFADSAGTHQISLTAFTPVTTQPCPMPLTSSRLYGFAYFF